MSSNYIKSAFFYFCALAFSASAFAQTKTSKPKVNQLGFYPSSIKIGVTPEVNASSFYIRNTSTGAIAFEGTLQSNRTNSPSDETLKLADFCMYLAL